MGRCGQSKVMKPFFPTKSTSEKLLTSFTTVQEEVVNVGTLFDAFTCVIVLSQAVFKEELVMITAGLAKTTLTTNRMFGESHKPWHKADTEYLYAKWCWSPQPKGSLLIKWRSLLGVFGLIFSTSWLHLLFGLMPSNILVTSGCFEMQVWSER